MNVRFCGTKTRHPDHHNRGASDEHAHAQKAETQSARAHRLTPKPDVTQRPKWPGVSAINPPERAAKGAASQYRARDRGSHEMHDTNVCRNGELARIESKRLNILRQEVSGGGLEDGKPSSE